MRGHRVYRAIDGTQWWVPRPPLRERLRARVELWGVALGLWAVVTACAPLPVPDPVPPDPTPNGGAGPVLDWCKTDLETCRECLSAGERVRELNCCRLSDGKTFATCPDDDSGTPLWQTPEGKPFAEACAYSAEQGRDWKPECLATIRDCGEIDGAMRGEVCR